MRRKPQMTAVLVTVCLAGALGVGMPSGSAQDNLIKIDGSSTVFPPSRRSFKSTPRAL